MKLLDGVKKKIARDGEKEEENARRNEGEEEIREEEIMNIICRLKDGKAFGSDEIPNEAWKYGRPGLQK